MRISKIDRPKIKILPFAQYFTSPQDHNITMEAMECLDEQVEKEIHGGEPTKVGFIRFPKIQFTTLKFYMK